MSKQKYLIIDTYKSQWKQDVETGCYQRLQKESYPLGWVDNFIFRAIPKVRGIASMLGKRPQGVDYYRYYSSVLRGKDRGKWTDEFTRVQQQLQSHDLCIEKKAILDVSGEPGFFAADASAICAQVDVTAFADSVTSAMKKVLKIAVKTYDFNADNLSELYENRKFDFIFVRYAIGFCQDLKGFVKHCDHILADDGIVYVSFSPASRAVCARWMFDDYTYLRQYTKEYMNSAFIDQNFHLLGEIDEGSFLWHDRMHPIQKLFASFYTKRIFDGTEESEKYQHNVAMIYSKGAGAAL